MWDCSLRYSKFAVQLGKKRQKRIAEHFETFRVAFGLSPESGRTMADRTVVSLDRVGLRFRFDVFGRRKRLGIRLPTIGSDDPYGPRFHLPPQFCARSGSSAANDKVEYPFFQSIDSNPNPAVFFFDRI